MKEFTFIRNNIDKWQRAEIIISDADSQSPDRLAEVYTDLTSDLAFAQTHYPHLSEQTFIRASQLHLSQQAGEMDSHPHVLDTRSSPGYVRCP